MQTIPENKMAKNGKMVLWHKRVYKRFKPFLKMVKNMVKC